jgi:hypothetical protein
MVMLIAGLSLAGGSALAQVTQPAQRTESTQPSEQAPPSQPTQGSQGSPQQLPQASQPPQQRFSADGLYNLANSYARAGKSGLAVLNYERAALLAPGDADINANLDYVRTTAHVPLEPRDRFARIAEVLSPALAAWVGLLGIVLVGSGLLARKITTRFRWVRVAGVLVGLSLVALTVSNAMLLWPRMRAAVILVNQTPARVSPVPMGDTAFMLPEAETVTMTAEHEDFVLIRTRGGRSGWVARADLGAVVP